MAGGFLGVLAGQVRLDVRQAVGAYAAVRAQNARTVYALRGTGDSFVQAGQTMATVGGGMVYAFGKVVNATAEFERKMDYAAAVSDATGATMQKLSDYALKLGQDTIYSAGQIADGFIELAKAGVSAEDIIGGIGKAMTDLGAAADIPLDQAGQIVTSTVQQFELALTDTVKVVDLLAGAANASIADISDIGVSMKYVGGVAHTAGISFEETATAISILAKAGIKGSTAGTSLRQIITSLGGSTEAARGQLQDLGIITEDGTNKFFDMQGEVKPLAEVFQVLQNSLDDAGYSAKDSLAAFKTIFNQRALSSVSILTRNGAKGFKEMYTEMAKTKAAEVAKQRLDNLSGDVEILRGNIETYMTKAGQPFQESLRGIVKNLTKLVQAFGELDPELQKNIIGFLGVGGAALVGMGLLNIVVGTIFRFAAGLLKMGAGLKFAGGLLKTFFKFMKGLPLLGILKNILPAIALAFGAISAPVLAVIAVIAALVVGFIALYKNSEGFRNAVNKLGGALKSGAKRLFDWLQLLMNDPGEAWKQLKDGLNKFLTKSIPKWLNVAKNYLIRNWPVIWAAIKKTAARALQFVIDKAADFIGWLKSKFTKENVGAAFRLVFDFIKNLWKQRLEQMKTLLNKFVDEAPDILNKLQFAGGYAIGFMIGAMVARLKTGVALLKQGGLKVAAAILVGLAQIVSKARRTAGLMVLGVIGAIRGLPGRAAGIASNVVTQFISSLQQLPTRAVGVFFKVMTAARRLNQIPGIVAGIATNIVSDFINTLDSIPAACAGIVGRAIAAFNGAIQSAYNSAKAFSSGLWSGFKDGLGINSPSFIEKHMVQMNDTVGTESKKLTRTTLGVQKLGEKYVNAAHQWRPGIPDAMTALSTANVNHMVSSAGTKGSGTSVAVKVRAPGIVGVEGTLDMGNAEAYITGVAEDAIERHQGHKSRRGKMGKN